MSLGLLLGLFFATFVARLLDPMGIAVSCVLAAFTAWTERWWHRVLAALAVALAVELILGFFQATRGPGLARVIGFFASLIHVWIASLVWRFWRRTRWPPDRESDEA
ncbi:hypothetical protein [Pelagibius sp.]|uniref:hypothetical protein n=1 Tax=Pelagibius sp. TaxID=1931238 RepID=UPI00262BF197|nr:hypothetical protein [Pelagibius sp.]